MTLVEMMFALTIGVVILGISTGFLVEVTRATLKTQNVSQNDLTEWGMYTGVTIDTRSANGMTLYKSFAPASFADSTDRITTNTTRGDFLLLTNSTLPTNSIDPPVYQSMTGYVYTAGAKPGTGTFQKFTYQVPVAEQTNALETILTAHYSHFVFVPVAVGLDATNSDNDPATPTNRAFLYRSTIKRSGVLNLQINSGFSSTNTANAKLVETSFYIRS
jgi:hypothetical protein